MLAPAQSSFRRSFLLKTTPLVVIPLGIAAWLFPHGALIVLAIFVSLTWLGQGLAQAAKRLEIGDEEIRMHGYVGGPATLRKQDIMSCRYVRAVASGRSYEFRFLEIRDNRGHGIRVWRYGWGRQRHQLFRLLAQWLESSGVSLDDAARRFLAAAAG